MGDIKMKKLYVPIITPFREDETVNYEALKKITKGLLSEGADGIYAGGSSAECFLMTMEERMKTLETVISAADGAPVIAHIGAIGTKLSEELAVHAEKAGASMISSVPPFYFSYDFESIKRYYWDLADSVKLPLMIYYIPSNTGHQLSAAQLAEIMDGRENITSIKFTSFDYYKMQQLHEMTKKEVISGKDEGFISAMAMNADGAIGTTFNYYFAHYKKILSYLENNDYKSAYEVQCKANAITAELCSVNLFDGVKVLLQYKGYDAGIPRRPNGRLDATSRKKLIDCYKNNMI